MSTWRFDRVSILTPREQQVLALACDGLSDDEIAQHFDITSLTVKHHMRNVYSKIGVRRRTHAVVRAIQTGLVTPQWLSSAWVRRPAELAARQA